MLPSAQKTQRRITYIAATLLGLTWLVIYTSTVSPSVNFIDSGELITTLYEPGIAHPPGYPLYTLMGYVVSHIPVGEVAWRVNFLSTFWGAVGVGALFLLIISIASYLRWRSEPVSAPAPARGRKARAAGREIPEAPPARQQYFGQTLSGWTDLAFAAGVASLYAASSTFWSRTAQAKMYSLHYSFVAFLFLAALHVRWQYERGDAKQVKKWLLVLTTALGLSFANHLTTLLVVPGLLILLLAGSEPERRFRTFLRNWYLAIPAAALPLLLYLYLPLRSSQHPLMNWGSPDNLGDFWRHITGWQYSAYVSLGDFRLLVGFIGQQWSWLTLPILFWCAVAGALLATRSRTLFAATFTTAAVTLVFTLFYSISEIEPYLAPLYMMLCLWLAAIPPTLFEEEHPAKTSHEATPFRKARLGIVAAAIVAALAVASAVLTYPQQDHSADQLAGQFASNVFKELPPNSVLLTDYWDFYGPTLYMQNVLGVRPDLAIVNTSLLTYPWYVGYLQKYRPALLAKSQNILPGFQREQRNWINGQPFDVNGLNRSYSDLITSFVDADPNSAAFVLLQKSDPRVVPQYDRRSVGLVSRLVPRTNPPPTTLPPEPEFALEGIVSGRRVPMDDFARLNSCLYVQAYGLVAQQYAAVQRDDVVQRLATKAGAVREAIPGQCR